MQSSTKKPSELMLLARELADRQKEMERLYPHPVSSCAILNSDSDQVKRIYIRIIKNNLGP